MEHDQFARGMALIVSTFDKEVSGELMEAYEIALSDLTDAEWKVGVGAAIRGERFFPVPKVLRDYARPQGSQDMVRASNTTTAQEIYEEIVDSYEGGKRLSGRLVGENWGRAALDAFAAAGGDGAFSWCEPRNEPFRRKAFIETFGGIATADPESLVPSLQAGPEAARAMLPGPERAGRTERPITRGEASAIFQPLFASAMPARKPPAPPQEPTSPRTPPHPSTPPETAPTAATEFERSVAAIRADADTLKAIARAPRPPVVATDERMAILKAQALEILGAPEPVKPLSEVVPSTLGHKRIGPPIE